jgi:hypothetical protein
MKEEVNLRIENEYDLLLNKKLILLLGQKKKYVCLRSPDPLYFLAADPNLFYWQLFDTNFC